MAILYFTGGLGNQLFQLSLAKGLEINGIVITLSKVLLNNSSRKLEVANICSDLMLEVTSEQCRCQGKKLVNLDSPMLADFNKGCCFTINPQNLGYSYHEIDPMQFAKFINNAECSNSECLKIQGVNTELALHIRLGDYLFPTRALKYGVLSWEYYKNILENSGENEKLIRVYCDDPVSLRRIYPELKLNNILLIEGNCAVCDLKAIAQARILVAANSTYSLWGAWLVSLRNGSIYVPAPFYRVGNISLFQNLQNMHSTFINPLSLVIRHPWTIKKTHFFKKYTVKYCQ